MWYIQFYIICTCLFLQAKGHYNLNSITHQILRRPNCNNHNIINNYVRFWPESGQSVANSETPNHSITQVTYSGFMA